MGTVDLEGIMATAVALCFWNLLADGMAFNEFATWGGDSNLEWIKRVVKITELLKEGLDTCDIFATVECDHAVQLYQRLLPDFPDLRALWVIGASGIGPSATPASKVKGVSSARAISVSRAVQVALDSGCAGLPNPPPSVKEMRAMLAAEVSSIVHTISLAASSSVSLFAALSAAGLTVKSWLQEAEGNIELASLAADVYAADINDLAFSDDGICIFWRESRVQLTRASVSSTPLQFPLAPFTIAIRSKSAVFCGWRKSGMPFVTAAAHFPSGETSKDFEARHSFTQTLLLDYAFFCSGIMPPPHGILLCDSNESSEYEAQFLEQGGDNALTLSHSLSRHALVDFASGDDGARCLKLRHGRGTQASKLGSLMFDRIDRIIMHPRLAALATKISLKSFARYPVEISDQAAAVRCNADARESLRDWVKQSNLGPDMREAQLPDACSFLRHLYPSQHAPSDHPPLAVSVTLPVTIFTSAADVLRYWFGPLYYSPQVDASQCAPSISMDILKERMGYWYSRASASFDEAQHMSADVVHAAAAGMLSGSEWAGPEGALAKLILLDQFPRCIFRGTPSAFQFDPAVLQLVLLMKSQGWLKLYDAVQLFFVGVAAQHSESSLGQQVGLEIAAAVQQCEQPDLQEFFKSLKGYPHEHVEVFSKFGRFPGRNAAAGRPSTAQELEWLSSPDCPAWCKSQTAAVTSLNPQSTSLLTYPHVLQAVSNAYTNQVSASDLVAWAVAAAENGLYCEAEQLFLRALSFEDTPSSREMCAQVAMENDCPAVAIEHASHAAALQPTWPLAFITLGRACRNAGNLRRASAAFTTALSLLDGSDTQAAEVRLEHSEVMQLLEQQHKSELRR